MPYPSIRASSPAIIPSVKPLSIFMTYSTLLFKSLSFISSSFSMTTIQFFPRPSIRCPVRKVPSLSTTPTLTGKFPFPANMDNAMNVTGKITITIKLNLSLSSLFKLFLNMLKPDPSFPLKHSKQTGARKPPTISANNFLSVSYFLQR
ncbi:hypothetical protein SDC9_176645 [bioreactor metagenome]|uniref:Uncharacterized protein n=1 Tax=bioreactor metagenome TaxID=1076179 RepID=A0A645GYS4_9ZZZZ